MRIGTLNTAAQTLQGVMSVAWSSDSSKLATANTDGTVKIWSRTGQLLRTLAGHTGGANGVDWDPRPSSNLLASSGDDRLIKIWDTNNGQLVATLTGHNDDVVAVDWSPTGSVLASLGGLETQNLRIWNTTNWSQVAAPSVGTITQMRWSPNGSEFAISGYPNIVATGNTINFSSTRIFQGHVGGVFSLDWSPSGNRLVSTGLDGKVRLWNLVTNQSLGILTSPNEDVWDIRYSPDGTRIAGALDDGTIRVWDGTTGQTISTLTQTGSMKSVAWSPDGTLLAYGGVNSSQMLPPSIISAPGGQTGPTATPTRTPTPGGPTATRTPTPTPTRTPTPGGRAVTSFTLVNADTDADILTLSDGYVLDLSVYPRVNVRANVSGQVESVRFGFDGNANYRTENGAPYAAGNNTTTTYDPWSLALGTHTLTATPYSLDNASGTAGAALTVQFSVVTGGSATATPTPVPATVLYRIDAGGSGGTFSGVSWAADAYFTGGVVSNLPNPIANTTDDGLYTTERSTSADTLGFSYALPVTNGTYTVRLHFAELYWVGGANRGIPGVNKRVFNVQLEGTTVLTNYDITADVGYLAAVTKTFTVTVTDGTLNINFPAASVNRPTLAALEVIGQ